MRNTVKRKEALIGIGLLLAGCSGGSTPVPSPSPTPPNTPEGKLRALLAAGGLVTLPAGTWVVNDPPLSIPAGTAIRGAGIGATVIKYTGALHLLSGNHGVTISDLTLDGSLCPAAPIRIGVALVYLQNNTTLLRVRIQSPPSFGVFVDGGAPTVQSCQFDDCGRTNFAEAIGGRYSEGPVLYDSNVFTNCHDGAIDNCGATGIWSNNSVLSLAPSMVDSTAGTIIADVGSTVIIKNNTLSVGSIQVYSATPGCDFGAGPPMGCQVLNNVIQTGTLCGTPLCPGLYIIPGNTHHGNVIGGVAVD